jgi:nucleotide-binding universal stress UspA family protein
MKTILAPLDFSPVSESVVAEAIRLAPALDARVVLLTVVQPPEMVADYAPLLQSIAEITAAGEKFAARKLAEAEVRLEAEFIPTETVQVCGSPADRILAEAERSRADYIIMGSHGHTALYDLLVGSTTQGVMKHASCPVLIVPAAEPARRHPRKSTRQHVS